MKNECKINGNQKIENNNGKIFQNRKKWKLNGKWYIIWYYNFLTVFDLEVYNY